MINTSIGKYKITRLIGEGGMASVYEATHVMLGTKVAIKVLNPILSANEQIRERFKNEAKLMASLNHKNITKISDFDEQPNQLSIILEFLEGEDLDEKIKRQGALPDDEILSIFKQAFSAFQYAHEKGIVHRDIKPSNIYILPDGRVKILDFGIAKLFGEGNEMTKTGTQMGTPIYMSPEQVKSDKSIDHRSDIYSLGITLYAAIVGKPPYDATTESQFEIFNKIVFEPIRSLGIESKYNDIVAKACNKDREQRYQSCEEWLEDLRTIQTSSSTVGQIPPLKPEEPVYEKTKIEEPIHPVIMGMVEPPKKKSNKLTPIIFISLGVIIILVIIGSLTKEDRSGIASAKEVNNLDSSDNINKTPLSSDNVTSDTTRILTDPDLSKDIKPSKRYSDVGPTPWTSSTKNYSITVNGKILQVADCDMPGSLPSNFYIGYSCKEAGSAVDALGNGWRFPTRDEFVQINQQLRLKGMGSFYSESCYFYRTKNYRPFTMENGQVIKIDATWCWDNYYEGSYMDDGTLWLNACVAGDGGAGKIRVVREN
jgi:serine/threonine protein kinase